MDKIIDKIIKKMKISDSLTDDEEIVRYKEHGANPRRKPALPRP